MNTSRRNFLKTGTAGTVGILAGTSAFPGKIMAAEWKQINPAIDNKRVVSCKDPRMVKNVPTSWSIATQNNAINHSVVHANMDEMARQLAQKSDIQIAWATIFQLPPGKQWSDVVVAIKVNCKEPQNLPRLAIIEKICSVLRNLGVKPVNIILYDGGDNANAKYGTYCSTTDAAKILANVSDKNSLLGGISPVTVSGASNTACTSALVKGTVDILVNIAVNKGHGGQYGGITLCMKNLYGSFCNSNDQSNASNMHNTPSLISINKHEALLGGAVPRQQLCIIDSIFAATAGPTGTPNQANYRIIMGTFAPTIDYLTAKKVREVEFTPKATHSATLAQLVTAFGYTESQLTSSFIEVPPAQTTGITTLQHISNKNILLHINAPHLSPAAVEFAINKNEQILSAWLMDLKGARIDQLNISGSTIGPWNGKTSAGIPVAQGTYVAALKTSKRVISEMVMVTNR